MALMMSCGVVSSKMTAASTHSSASSDLHTLGFRVDRPVLALVGPDGPVGIHRDDEGVTERPRVTQVANVTGMKQVEHAVREDHRAATRSDALGERGGRGCAG